MIIQNPFQILKPEERWYPSESQMDAFQNQYEKLLPPLVYKIRKAVADWREQDYKGISKTTKSLFKFWFQQEHSVNEQTFQFFFSQREAIESIVYLYEVAKAQDKINYHLYDLSGNVADSSFYETWTRYVIKMATGAGKTKVMGLTLVWSYFHKLYEEESKLSKNFLVIAPNIIVLNRLQKDFGGLKMFFEEPFIPENGFEDKNWLDDFQITLHIQDDLKQISESGNIFLTNIHRVFFQETVQETTETTFLGTKPKPNADTDSGLDLGKVLRSSKIEDLVILNDEAHHIHDQNMAWFKSIENINSKILLKTGKKLSLQADFSATPKHNNGAIFVQTICDYPLVEAIKQNVVKTPVLPDMESRAKLSMIESTDFAERYGDYMELAYAEWKRECEERKDGKTPILFVMTINTKEADEAAAFLENKYSEMRDAVLVIHTNENGEMADGKKGKKAKEELEKLRKAADEIDKNNSPYKAVVSVLMLREGWDVKNVTTIVGLRPFKAESKILPEQAIGRGLRKMCSLQTPEKLVIIGTDAFLEFVEQLAKEGVNFEYSPMSLNNANKNTLLIEIDVNNKNKDLQKLNIKIPKLSPKIQKNYKSLDLIDIESFDNELLRLKQYEIGKDKEIIFNDFEGNFSHKTNLEDKTPDYRNVIAFLTKSILRENKLLTGFELLYPKVEEFIAKKLFVREVELENVQTIKNLAEPAPLTVIRMAFKKAIDKLMIMEVENPKIDIAISLLDTKPKIVKMQSFLIAKKSVFNKIIGDNAFELEMAAFLENKCIDVISYAKNTINENGVNFYIEYQAENGNISKYYPDFFVKTNEKTFFILETKGREDLDDIRKINRLAVWCRDINKNQTDDTYNAVYVKQEEWEKQKNRLKNFEDLWAIFKVL